MEIPKRKSFYYNNYFPTILNNNNIKRNFLTRSPLNNLNKITPSYSGNPKIIKKRDKVYPPNYSSNIIKNTSFNIYELNIPNRNINLDNIINNESNNFSSKYSTSSSSSLYLNNSKNYSPPSNYLQLKATNYNNQRQINKNLSSPYLSIKNTQNFKRKKTLILDLDETLVHSGFNPFSRKSDITLSINIDGKNHMINVLKRPFVDEFLMEMSQFFEIIIFTASISEYASPLLDKLDKNNYCSRRLFRQDCLFNHGLYVKDLKIIGKELKDMIIIDNNPVSYAVNEDNGIPILTWYDDVNDKELIKLIPLLKYLSIADDVRPIIRQIVNKRTNEVDFYTVSKIMNDKNYENNENLKNILCESRIANNNYDLYRNIRKELNSENINYNINEIRFKNYLNNNNYFKYNNNIDSFSNMTYNEIQNEGHINNNNFRSNYNNVENENINSNINYYNYKKYEENENIVSKTNSFLNKDEEMIKEKNKIFMVYKKNEDNKNKKIERNNKYNNNNFNSNNNEYKINIEKNNNIIKESRSYTPNINIKRKISYYNGDNSNINIYINNSNNNEQNNNILHDKDNNNMKYRRINNNYNNKGSLDIFKDVKNNDEIRINNYLSKPLNNEYRKEKNEGLSDYYLQSYKKHLLKSKIRGNRSNYNNIFGGINEWNDVHNNIRNVNYNNVNIREETDNSKYKYNNNLKIININQNLLNKYISNSNNILNKNNYQNINNNEINLDRKYKNNEINNNIRKENQIYDKSFNNNLPNNNNNYSNINIKNENNSSFIENVSTRKTNNYNEIHSKNTKEISLKKNNNNYLKTNNNLDNLNRSFSLKKNYLLNNYSKNYNNNNNKIYNIDEEYKKQNNIGGIRRNDNLDDKNFYNHRIDTEISTNKKINDYLINNEYNNEDRNYNNNRIIKDNRDSFNYTMNIRHYENKDNNKVNRYMINYSQNFNDNKYRYLKELNKTEERRYTPIKNNIFRDYQNDNDKIKFFNERNNYNNININNFYFYNSLLDKNFKFRNEIPNNNNDVYKYNNIREENNNEDDIKMMNKSSSFFHPTTMIRTFFSEEEDKKDNGDGNNGNKEIKYEYKYKRKNKFNEINKNKILRENNLNPFPINRNILLRNKLLVNYNNNMKPK